ncbi:MAG: IS1634 family transposase [Oscillatoria sp. SIO1A7]|nr:IS1634 family transposase [Oscillatoria sp. SIO1A7]
MMDLVCTSDGDVPLWMRIGSGNESDQKQFASAMIDFKKQLRLDSLMVADSAFYTQENIGNFKNMRWISRVPLTVKAAKKLVSEIDSDEFTKSQLTGYRYLEFKNNYGGIEQRWVVVESEKRRESYLKIMAKRIEKDWQLALKKIG